MGEHGNISGGVIKGVRQDIAYNEGTTTYTYEITLMCKATEEASLTPAINDSLASNTDYKFSRKQSDDLGGGLRSLVLTYSYKKNETSVEYSQLPETNYTEQVSREDVDIKLHPYFNDWKDYWDYDNDRFYPGSVINGEDFTGVTKFIKSNIVVTKTEYFFSKPNSLATSHGKLIHPGGDYPGSADNWIMIGSSRSKTSNVYTRESSYEYSADGFNTEIYDYA